MKAGSARDDIVLNGIGVSEGCGVGRAVLLEDICLDYSGVKYISAEKEKARLEKAIEAFAAKAEKEAKELRKSAGEKAAEIPEGHLTILNDPLVRLQLEAAIDGKAVAEAAVDYVCSELYNRLANVDDEIISQRADDIKDIKESLIGILLGVKGADIASAPKGSILIAREFTPSVICRINSKNVRAIIAETGADTSHAAILARTMGIPAAFSVLNARQIINNGDKLIVDGFTGKVITEPGEAEIIEYEKKQNAFLKEQQGMKAFFNMPAANESGADIRVCGNIGNAAQAQSVIQNGGEGVGLFRTEFLFMNKKREPSEEEQLEAYSSVAKAMNGREVIIRTLDIGGDKTVDYLKTEKENNPLLGLRAIRYCLKNSPIYKKQLRAILRAAYFGNVKLLLPLITTPEEVRFSKRLINECAAELDGIGISYRIPPLGIMIETPSAALISDLLATEADFFSIGTNDLTGYIMAADRGNSAVCPLSDVFQPAVLRAIETTVKNAKRAKIPVAVCGEAAADERLIPKLVEWGVDSLSVSPSLILRTKQAVFGCK